MDDIDKKIFLTLIKNGQMTGYDIAKKIFKGNYRAIRDQSNYVRSRLKKWIREGVVDKSKKYKIDSKKAYVSNGIEIPYGKIKLKLRGDYLIVRTRDEILFTPVSEHITT